ncbi:hypothetical protein I3843_15G130900 [Carya illinoinensis]|nr:hypothetical protein I3843_15G130900 [Carya illinoinensis]
MFRRLGWFIGLNYTSWSTKRLPDAKPRPARVKPVAMLDTVQEIAIYIHRFHNLDLFQQGWYQIKITIRWEDSEYTSLGTPARVVQYEAPDLGSDDVCGVWRIDDTDNSFSTQPFRVKYARQDVLLSIMISFNLPLGIYEGPPASAVILKFELMYAPVIEKGSEVPSDFCTTEDDAGDSYFGSNVALAGRVASVHLKEIMLLKALLTSRDILLEELQKLSREIDKAVDLTDFISKMDDMKLFDPVLRANLGASDGQVSGQGKPRNGLEKSNGTLDLRSEELLRCLSQCDLLNSFNTLGDQMSYLWNAFLKFHRGNERKILEFLRDIWAKDRRAEWSIWMVYSKVEMPHHYINGGLDESSHHGVHKRVSTMLKLTDDPAQTAAMRAELHRRSISQMNINNRSIQDMHLFGNPSQIPIVIIERVTNAPRRTTSANSYLRHLDVIDSQGLLIGPSSASAIKQSDFSLHQNVRALKIVVFVHGFQGHHLDLRLVRNQWLLLDPKTQFLMSEANEDKTSDDFREMGLRLAQEVVSFVKKKMDKVSRSGSLGDIRLSFVGHSIGNIIIRTALAENIMEPFLRYLYTYVSISGPHLGYLYSSNSLFNSGLWILKKLKGTQCIHQLTFTDDPDLQNTFLYKLCKEKTLERFKHVILLSSPQDGYVPYHSARIESCQAASLDSSKKSKAFLDMLNNCLDQIRAPSSEYRVFMRCDVNFDTSSYGKNLNTFIGRAAHIEFLESDIFARFIMWSFPEFFR